MKPGDRVVTRGDGSREWNGRRAKVVSDVFFDLNEPHVYIVFDQDMTCDRPDCTQDHRGQRFQVSTQGIRLLSLPELVGEIEVGQEHGHAPPPPRH